jgi:hypothetical protein
MYNFMGDTGQFYQDGVKEIEEGKLVKLDLRQTIGPVAIVAFNDDPLAIIQSRLKVGFELEGHVKTELFILN